MGNKQKSKKLLAQHRCHSKYRLRRGRAVDTTDYLLALLLSTLRRDAVDCLDGGLLNAKKLTILPW